MEGFAKAVQQPEYVHILLNHLPLTGLLVALLFLVAALVMNHRPAALLALGGVALLSLSAWPVAHFGEEAYDRVLAMSDEAGSEYLKRHAELADRWIFLYYVTSGFAAAALAVGWRKPKLLRPMGAVAALLAVASLIAGGVIAENGGKIRHREFRHQPPPNAYDEIPWRGSAAEARFVSRTFASAAALFRALPEAVSLAKISSIPDQPCCHDEAEQFMIYDLRVTCERRSPLLAGSFDG
jgi:hypothetical protein